MTNKKMTVGCMTQDGKRVSGPTPGLGAVCRPCSWLAIPPRATDRRFRGRSAALSPARGGIASQEQGRHTAPSPGVGPDTRLPSCVMQPTVIFLFVILIWAVYLVQHWITRREHLATMRSVDRFSSALRVLERRALAPTGNARRHRSYDLARSVPAGVGARVSAVVSRDAAARPAPGEPGS